MVKARQRGEPNEETLLLPSSSSSSSSDTSTTATEVIAPTPLPKFQLAILLLLQFCEPICSQCIYPFINQLITDFGINGGDEKQTGYYAGLIISLFFVAEATTVFRWSSLSDTIGRKPILLTGLFGAGISMLCFGLSRTLWGLVVSRCLAGFLNGNIGVMKSMMGEITDSTNRAQGFALIPITYSMGSTIGPLFGGFLSRPRDRFPNYFGGEFWKMYPYFLPCAASALFVAITAVITLACLKETVPIRKVTSRSNNIRQVQPGSNVQVLYEPELEVPVPLRELFVFPVIISVINYATLAFLDSALLSLIALFFATPVEFGGLGLSPLVIGRCYSVLGLVTGTIQALFFAKIVQRWGVKRLFFTGILSFIPAFSLFPLANLLVRAWGWNPLVWGVLWCGLAFLLVTEMGYGTLSSLSRAVAIKQASELFIHLRLPPPPVPPKGSIFICITTAAPNSRSLGATNGLAQTTVSITRAVGPAIATSLFALSAEHNLLGGYAVFGVFVALSCIALFAAAKLPEGGRVEEEEGCWR